MVLNYQHWEGGSKIHQITLLLMEEGGVQEGQGKPIENVSYEATRWSLVMEEKGSTKHTCFGKTKTISQRYQLIKSYSLNLRINIVYVYMCVCKDIRELQIWAWVWVFHLLFTPHGLGHDIITPLSQARQCLSEDNKIFIKSCPLQ